MTTNQTPLEVETGSDNVFADLGLEDAPGLRLKAAITGRINAILQQRRLTQVQAAALLDLSQPKISALRNGKLLGFSLEKLLELMVKLDRNVEIGFTRADAEGGSHYVIRDEDEQRRIVA